jgi:hypothetical protein
MEWSVLVKQAPARVGGVWRSGRFRGVYSVHRGDRRLAVVARFHQLMEGLLLFPRIGRVPHLTGYDHLSAEPVRVRVGSMADRFHTTDLKIQQL